MATLRWIGNALKTPQVVTIQITAYDATTTYSVSINDKLIGVLGDTDADTTAAALCAALQDSQEGEFTELSYSVTTDTITITGADSGEIFTAVENASGGTGTIAQVVVTAGTGPNDLTNELNWSTGAVPANGDTVYFDNCDVDCLDNLDGLSAVTLAALYIEASYTGKLGRPNRNPNGYEEYRPQYLKIGATLVRVGGGQGSGSGLIRLDTDAAQTAIEVLGTGGSSIQNQQAFCWKGTHISNTVETRGGSFGAAMLGGETANIATGTYTAGDVYLGPGCVNTHQSIGTATVMQYSGCSGTVTVFDQAQVTLRGTGGMGTLQIYNGTYYYESSGTATTVQVGGGGGGTLDCSRDGSPRTFTNCTIKAGGTIIDPLSTITYTNGIARAAGARQIQAT